MTDWLEVARRELAVAPEGKEVSSVSAVGGVGAFKKSEASQLHRHTVYDVEVPFGISDEALPLEDDDNTKAHTPSPAKIAETPVSSILAVGDNGSVDKSLPDDHSENENATVVSPPTSKPSKTGKGRVRNCRKLTKSLAADWRDRAVRFGLSITFAALPLVVAFSAARRLARATRSLCDGRGRRCRWRP